MSPITFNPVPNSNTNQAKVTCRGCQEEFVLLATDEEVFKYVIEEALVQDAFPRWTPDERELLISQTCGKCWDELIPEDFN